MLGVELVLLTDSATVVVTAVEVRTVYVEVEPATVDVETVVDGSTEVLDRIEV